MWPEAQACLDANKHELKVSGATLAARLEESNEAVPDELCQKLGPVLTRMELSKCPTLTTLPGSISSFTTLYDLLLPDNGLTALPDSISGISVLRSLTVEGNQLTSVPDSICRLPKLQSLNLSRNKLTQLPAAIGDLQDLSHLNVSSNSLEQLPLSFTKLSHLSILNGSHNTIASLPSSVSRLSQLSDLNLSANKLVALPAALASCPKIKVLELSDNPFKDKKLPKVLKEGRLKATLAYITKNGAAATAAEAAAEAEATAAALQAVKLQAPRHSYTVLAAEKGASVDVYIHPSTKAVRPHLVCAVIPGLQFTPALFQNFISLQTDLHNSMCAKRSLAAIGTHDLSALQLPLHYEALPPADISFVPLVRDADGNGSTSSTAGEQQQASGSGAAITAAELAGHFAGDATMLRYLSYISATPSSAAPLYAVLRDSKPSVLSVPPVINAEHSRVSSSTTEVLLEVSSTKSLELAQEVALAFLEGLGAALAAEAGGGEGAQMPVKPVRLLTPGTDHVRLVFPRPA